MKNIIASVVAYVLKRVLRRKDLSDIINVFNRVETDLLAYLSRQDAKIESLDGQIIAMLDARGAAAEEAARAQRVLGRVGAITA